MRMVAKGYAGEVPPIPGDAGQNGGEDRRHATQELKAVDAGKN
jgi:hypothetical protein